KQKLRKNLDAQFENDEPMTPLASALMIWCSVEKEQDKLHEEIQNLIEIQAIAVCMENGNFKEAEVFGRIFGDPNSYMPFKRKLFMIISRKDTFYSFFQHFGYNHMTEKIKSYVNYVLSGNKRVESKRARTITSQEKPNGNDVEMETEANLDTRKRPHRNLCLSKLKHGAQQQDLNKKERRVGTLQSARKKKESRRATESRIPVLKGQLVTPGKKRQVWLWEEDKNWRSGVRKFQEGTMKKLKQICSDSED
uniref:Telomere repeat-binding factor dimerisation domain-containing protein n=1 Tax=Cebus imitator TaxID=2715852 RepID=A0A2K5QGX5_CEBIM